MPTIAHLLQPSIERNLNDLERQLPPPDPAQQQSLARAFLAGHEHAMTTLGPRGRDAAPPAKEAAPDKNKILGQMTVSTDRALGRPAGDAFAEGALRGMHPGYARKAADESSGRDKAATNIKKTVAPKQGEYYSTPVDDVLERSLMNVPQADLKNTIGYLASLGNRQFVPALSRGFANSELHPSPSVAPMQRGYLQAQPQMIPNAAMRPDGTVDPNAKDRPFPETLSI
jgi:hypothetical protein